jgi:hypothetical protein
MTAASLQRSALAVRKRSKESNGLGDEGQDTRTRKDACSNTHRSVVTKGSSVVSFTHEDECNI